MNFFKWFSRRQPQEQPPQPVDMDTFVPRFLKLVKPGMTRDALLQVLASNQVTEGELAAWLRQRDTVDEEGWRQLGEIVEGELGEVVREVLGNKSEPGESPPPPSGNESEAESWFKRGVQQFMAGDFRGAVASYDQALTLNPQYHEAWFIRGYALDELGRYEEAIASYDQALTLNPQFYQAWNGRGYALDELGRYEEAIASCDQALTLNPQSHLAWTNRGIALNKLGRYEEAIASYDQALTLNPQFHLAWNNRGYALDELGRYEEAIASCDQALTLNPQYHQAWSNRGNALNGLGRNEEAIASYDQALTLNPQYYQAWTNRGIALGKLGRNEEAIASCDQALTLNPQYYQAWTNRGAALNNLGRYEEAIASYDQALTLNPQYYQAWDNRGNALNELGRNEEAIASCDQALTLNPQSHHAWHGRGIAAASSPHFNPQSQQNFLFYFPSPIHFSTSTLATPETNPLLSSLGQYQPLLPETFSNPQHHQNFPTHFLTSLQQSQQILRQTYADSPQILETLTLPSLENLQQNLSISPTELLNAIQTPPTLNPDQLTPTPEQLQNLKNFTQQLLSEQVLTTLHQTAQNHFNLTHPELNQRGFWGKINSLQFPLTHDLIGPNTHPEAWGFLHRELGKAYLEQSLTPSQHSSDRDLKLSQRDCWRKAKTHYKQALQPLTFEQYPKQHLQTLKDLIQVCQLLQDSETDFFLQEATTRTDRIRQDPNLHSLIPHILPIQQYTVDRAVQQNQPTQALHLAETSKNTCLRWLWGYGETPTLKDTHFQQLLTPNTALIYWHYSPNALTTFLLLPNQPSPLLIPSPTSSLDQLLDLEKWIENWHTTYNTYSKKTQTEKANSPWRSQLANQLQHLHTLLNIPAIEQHLQTHNIQTLLLIPHRDLHRFPLHSFFNLPATYLPSAYLAFFDSPFPRPLTTLNLIENPNSTPTVNNEKKDLAPLPYAEIEAALLRQKFSTATSLQRDQATHRETLSLLTTPAQVFHFCGHAAYNPQTPLNSCLFLQGEHTLTLKDILQQDLNAYALVSLAACETAITGNHSITDEYVGLVSAFLQTGVTYVLSTLWQVESFVTSLFMVQFYDTLQQGTPPIPALYQTQKWLKTATPTTLSHCLDTHLNTLTPPPTAYVYNDDETNLLD